MDTGYTVCNQIVESESGKESKVDINISVVVIGNVCYGDWGSKWNSIA